MTQRPSTPSIAVAGLLAALVTLATMLFHLPVPSPAGYVHLGDAFILFSAMLAGPAAAAIGGIGGALADLLGGFPVYAPATLCIKALVGFLAGRRLNLHDQHALLRCALNFAAAELVMVVGYLIYNSFLSGFATAASAVLGDLVQAASGVVLACVLLPLARRIAPVIRGGGRPL